MHTSTWSQNVLTQAIFSDRARTTARPEVGSTHGVRHATQVHVLPQEGMSTLPYLSRDLPTWAGTYLYLEVEQASR